MSRSKKRKKNDYSQEFRLLAALLSIVVVVGIVCVVLSKQDDETNVDSTVSATTSSDVSSVNDKNNVGSKIENTSSGVLSDNPVVSGSATVESSSSDSQTVDVSMFFDDSANIGYTVDSWNLLLVNSENRLSSDYVPELHEQKISGVHSGGYQISVKIYDAYKAMVEAAKKDGVKLVACSIYRQYSSQERNYNNRVTKLMNEGLSREEAEEKAATVIARPGTSEHQTGLSVDFNPCTDAFEKSAQYKWLSENAEDFGFVQRYKASKSSITGIINESWHYRYVGVAHAKKMNGINMCLEEYIEYLKGQ